MDELLTIGAFYSTDPHTGITVNNLTVCGGFIQPAADVSPPNYVCQKPKDGSGNFIPSDCQTYGGCAADLNITNTGTIHGWSAGTAAFDSYDATNPFDGTKPFNVNVTNTWFFDAPDYVHSVFMFTDVPGQTISDVQFYRNFIATGGIQMGGFGNWFDHTQCDNYKGSRIDQSVYANDQSLNVPRNMRFESNNFYGGVISGFARYVGFTNNTADGYYSQIPDLSGMIEMEQCADQVKIEGNTLRGNWKDGSAPDHHGIASTPHSGMELYGRNITITNNVVTGVAEEAIGILSTYNTTVINNHLWRNNLSGDSTEEIKIATRHPGAGVCSPDVPHVSPYLPCTAQRDVQMLTIQDNDATDPNNVNHLGEGIIKFGIYFDACCDGSTNAMKDIHISGNRLSGAPFGADYRVAIDGVPVTNGSYNFSTQVTTLGNSSIDGPLAFDHGSSGTGPQTIAVFPEGPAPAGTPFAQLSNNLVTDPNLPNRRLFLFGGNDPTGFSNFYFDSCSGSVVVTQHCYGSIQGYFETAAINGNALGGPVAVANGSVCSFLYLPARNGGTLYLDDGFGVFNYSSSMNVGPMPTAEDNTVENAACRIHSKNSVAIGTANNLLLILEIEFKLAGTWYAFETVANNDGYMQADNQSIHQESVINAQGTPIAWSLWGYWLATLH